MWLFKDSGLVDRVSKQVTITQSGKIIQQLQRRIWQWQDLDCWDGYICSNSVGDHRIVFLYIFLYARVYFSYTGGCLLCKVYVMCYKLTSGCGLLNNDFKYKPQICLICLLHWSPFLFDTSASRGPVKIYIYIFFTYPSFNKCLLPVASVIL